VKNIRFLRDDIKNQIEAASMPKALKRELFNFSEYVVLLENELAALMGGAKTILSEKGFTESARAIFDFCTNLTGATSGYVALLSDDGEENEVLFLEAGNLPCDVDPGLPMPIRGLREQAYRTNKTVFDNDFMNSKWAKYMPEGHVVLNNVMFAPLVIEEKTVGIIGLANKPSDFTERDAFIATGFGELAAISLSHNRNLDKKRQAREEREIVIKDLKEALHQVKTLSGLLPICSYCKKIRDDKGYWNQIDAYIQQHSDARFSHGICKECLRKYHPDVDPDEV
jgi:hypothetical protein